MSDKYDLRLFEEELSVTKAHFGYHVCLSNLTDENYNHAAKIAEFYGNEIASNEEKSEISFTLSRINIPFFYRALDSYNLPQKSVFEHSSGLSLD